MRGAHIEDEEGGQEAYGSNKIYNVIVQPHGRDCTSNFRVKTSRKEHLSESV